MSEKVSVSQTGQDQPAPSRRDRDAAFSSTGGRKAAEVSKEPVVEESRETDNRFVAAGGNAGTRAGRKPEQSVIVEPPIGLDLETRADAEWVSTNPENGVEVSWHEVYETETPSVREVPEQAPVIGRTVEPVEGSRAVLPERPSGDGSVEPAGAQTRQDIDDSSQGRQALSSRQEGAGGEWAQALYEEAVGAYESQDLEQHTIHPAGAGMQDTEDVPRGFPYVDHGRDI